MEVEETVLNKKYYKDSLREFLKSQMKDYEYFLHGTRTNLTESFHNLCNKYYQKGSTITYSHYIMKKEFAGMDWNEQRSGNIPAIPWQQRVINSYLEKLNSSQQ